MQDDGGDGLALEEMLDALPERVARYRRGDLMLLYANAAKAADYGLTPKEVRGRRLDELLEPEAYARVRDHLARLTPEAPVRRLLVGDCDDRIEWVDQLMPDDHGGEILSVGRDVTARYLVETRLDESERRFAVAMDEAPIGMALVGLDGSLLRVNRALCAFVGRSAKELLTMTTLDITHPDDVGAELDDGQRLLTEADQPLTRQKRYVRPDGIVVWGLLKVSLVRDGDGQPLYMIGQVVDITDRVDREAELERAATEERDVATRLRELDELKNTFLTAVSHELRTPLTAVQGFAELLRSRGSSLSAERSDELLDRLADNARRLGELLVDLLDLDRLTRGSSFEPTLAETDLAALVRDAVAVVGIDDGTLDLDLREVHLAVDAAKVERVVENLMANAVRHTPDGTTVWVRLRPEDGGARLTVEDAGAGVSDALKATIFEPFTMGASEASRVGGTGIGLAIVRRFTALHGGRAWVEDRAGGGAAFHVWLPGGDAPTSGG